MEKDSNDKKEHADEPKNSVTAILIIIAVIIVIVVVIYFVASNTKKNVDNGTYNNKIVYNHYTFNKENDNAWYVQLSIKGAAYDIPFYYNPQQVENITIDPEVFTNFKNYLNKNPGGLTYVTFDPNESSKAVIAGIELARVLGDKYNIFNLNVKSALISIPDNVTSSSPVITCQNNTDFVLVVLFAKGSDNRVSSFNNCIILQYKTVNDSIMVADALTFRLLTITRDPVYTTANITG